MRNVSHKPTTKRTAVAQAELIASESTLKAIQAGTIPKGDPLPVAKIAAVMAAKKTTEWIPYCHNIPIEFVDVQFELLSNRILVTVEVISIAKTGVEMEALTAAAAAVLNLYDMLKMIDDDMEIGGIKLLQKKGGKSDFVFSQPWNAAVIVVSDRVSQGQAQDGSGEALLNGLQELGAKAVSKIIVPDEVEAIRAAVLKEASQKLNFILITGGTGIGSRDVSPEALGPLFRLKLSGIEESLRRYGQERIPTAFLSRSVAGVVEDSIVVCLPGSPNACKDALSVLFPGVFHAISMLKDAGHP